MKLSTCSVSEVTVFGIALVDGASWTPAAKESLKFSARFIIEPAMTAISRMPYDFHESTLPWCCLNGAVIPSIKASIPVFDRGFLYGDGLFETLRIHRQQPFQWKRHWERFSTGCHALGIPLETTEQHWLDQLKTLISANRADHAMVRMHLSRGSGPRGYAPPSQPTPTSLISMHPAPELAPGNLKSWNLIISSMRHPSAWDLNGWKTSNKLFQILVKSEAQSKGADDALVLNEQDRITETSSANLLMVMEDQIITPSRESGILEGTTRSLIRDFAKELSIPFRETDCDVSLLKGVQSVFASLSSFGLVHVARIDDLSYPLHPIEEALYTRYLSSLHSL